MRFLIHMSTSEEAGSLARMLRLWTWSTCADMETELWSPGASGPAIVIWDLDAGLPPPGMVSSASTALLVCSSRSQAAIDSDSPRTASCKSPSSRKTSLPLCAAVPGCGGTLWSGWRFSQTVSGSASPCAT